MRLWWVEFRPVLAARSPVSSSRPFLCQASLAALQYYYSLQYITLHIITYSVHGGQCIDRELCQTACLYHTTLLGGLLSTLQLRVATRLLDTWAGCADTRGPSVGAQL